jgi:hypothetical protein
MITLQTILPWADLFWVPVALAVAEPGKRLLTAGFAGACVLLLRLQVELLQELGLSRGFFGLMQSDILNRGMVTYGVFILFFLIIAHFSKGTYKTIHLAASITIMITAFCVSTLIMVL